MRAVRLQSDPTPQPNAAVGPALTVDGDEVAPFQRRLGWRKNILYAQDRWSVLLIFQAMDAAGKDGAIKHVMSGVNPQGSQVYSFKASVRRRPRSRLPVADHEILSSGARPHRRLQPVVTRPRRSSWCASIPRSSKKPKAPDPARRQDSVWDHRGYDSIRDFERHPSGQKRRRRAQVLLEPVEERSSF